jgi:hypothetical protein
MAQGSGFFKGENKKKKKSGGGQISFTPTFVPPAIIPKGKDKN